MKSKKKEEQKKKMDVRGAREGRFMKESGFEYIDAGDDLKIPEWMSCTWKRVRCGKKTCPICGKLDKSRMSRLKKGENPDSMEIVLEDMGREMSKAFKAIKAHAAKMGIDIRNLKEDIVAPPKPGEFPLYRKITRWNRGVWEIFESGESFGSLWLGTEAAADIFWYKDTLGAKAYRQLCNRWYLDRGYDYGEFDLAYTNDVLSECIGILKKSLTTLSLLNSSEKGLFILSYSALQKLESEIKDI